MIRPEGFTNEKKVCIMSMPKSEFRGEKFRVAHAP